TVVISALELVAGIAVAIGFTLWETSLGREIPPQALSRVMSMDWFTTTRAMPVGFALVAPAAQLFGTQETMLACGLIVIVLCVAALAVGDVRRLRAPCPRSCRGRARAGRAPRRPARAPRAPASRAGRRRPHAH